MDHLIASYCLVGGSLGISWRGLYFKAVHAMELTCAREGESQAQPVVYWALAAWSTHKPQDFAFIIRNKGCI